MAQNKVYSSSYNTKVKQSKTVYGNILAEQTAFDNGLIPFLRHSGGGNEFADARTTGAVGTLRYE